MFLVALAGSAAASDASALRVDLDRDGIGDIVRITEGPARPGLELWLSSTQMVARLRVKGRVHAVVAADLNMDGWPELVASGSSRDGLLLHVWKNGGRGVFEHLKRKRARHGRIGADPRNHYDNTTSNPLSPAPVRAFDQTGPPADLSYFPLHLTPAECTTSVQFAVPPASTSQPRSPRAPPSS